MLIRIARFRSFVLVPCLLAASLIATSALAGAIPQRTALELLRRAGLAEGRQ